MLIRQLGRVDYLPTYEAMQAFTANRNPDFTKENVPYGSIYVDNQLWICEHNAVLYAKASWQARAYFEFWGYLKGTNRPRRER